MAPVASLALPLALSNIPSPLSWVLFFLSTCFSLLFERHVRLPNFTQSGIGSKTTQSIVDRGRQPPQGRSSEYAPTLPTCDALPLKRRCARFGHLLVLLDGAGAHADRPHNITVATQGDAPRKDYEVPPVRVAQAKDRPSGLRLVYQVLRLSLKGYRCIGLIDRDADAPDESAVHPDVGLQVPACVHDRDVHGAVDLLRLLFCGVDDPARLL